MKKRTNLSLQEEVKRETEQVEKKLEEEVPDEKLKVTAAMDQALMEKIREYEKQKQKEKGKPEEIPVEETESELPEEISEESAWSEEFFLSDEDREALELGRKMLHGELRYTQKKSLGKKQAWIVLAAALVLVFAVGATAVGSRSYWKSWYERKQGNQKNVVSTVEDMDSKNTEKEKENPYREIDDTFQIRSSHPRMILSDMVVDHYGIDEKQKVAKVFYKYKGMTMLYGIYVNGTDSSYSEQQADDQTDNFEVKTEKQTIQVQEYWVEETETYRYVANFEYKGIYYRLKGTVDREIFEEILKNLYYV